MFQTHFKQPHYALTRKIFTDRDFSPIKGTLGLFQTGDCHTVVSGACFEAEEDEGGTRYIHPTLFGAYEQLMRGQLHPFTVEVSLQLDEDTFSKIEIRPREELQPPVHEALDVTAKPLRMEELGVQSLLVHIATARERKRCHNYDAGCKKLLKYEHDWRDVATVLYMRENQTRVFCRSCFEKRTKATANMTMCRGWSVPHNAPVQVRGILDDEIIEIEIGRVIELARVVHSTPVCTNVEDQGRRCVGDGSRTADWRERALVLASDDGYRVLCSPCFGRAVAHDLSQPPKSGLAKILTPSLVKRTVCAGWTVVERAKIPVFPT